MTWNTSTAGRWVQMQSCSSGKAWGRQGCNRFTSWDPSSSFTEANLSLLPAICILFVLENCPPGCWRVLPVPAGAEGLLFLAGALSSEDETGAGWCGGESRIQDLHPAEFPWDGERCKEQPENKHPISIPRLRTAVLLLHQLLKQSRIHKCAKRLKYLVMLATRHG